MGKAKEARDARVAARVRAKDVETIRTAIAKDAATRPAREAEALRVEYRQRVEANPVAAAAWLAAVPLREKTIFEGA
jgi:hypothetical protein